MVGRVFDVLGGLFGEKGLVVIKMVELGFVGLILRVGRVILCLGEVLLLGCMVWVGNGMIGVVGLVDGFG